MTPILKVITEYCDIYVDDINLKELADSDPALYARRMWQYLLPSISLFSIPPEMQNYLVGNENEPNIVLPKYNSYRYAVPEDKEEPFTIQLPEGYKGFSVFSCRIEEEDNVGNIVMVSVNDIATYNDQTGEVTINASSAEKIYKNTVFEMDFYADGYFKNTLSGEVMNILGMCFQVTWQDRFNTDWLSIVSKVEDKSFYEQNRANKMRADTERIQMLRSKLANTMRKYEQNLWYNQTIGNKIGIR